MVVDGWRRHVLLEQVRVDIAEQLRAMELLAAVKTQERATPHTMEGRRLHGLDGGVLG